MSDINKASDKIVKTLESKLEVANSEILKLKAELWVAKDSRLRTYDGLAQKADKYDVLAKATTDLIRAITSTTSKMDESIQIACLGAIQDFEKSLE